MTPSRLYPWLIAALSLSAAEPRAQALPRLPIGMNLHGHTYYGPPIFTDAMKSASDWISFNAAGESPWDTELAGDIPKDSAGYPLEIPYTVTPGGRPQAVRCMLNNFLKGDYVVIFSGDGEVSAGGVSSSKQGNLLHIAFTGAGTHAWLNILRSAKGNPVRNMVILPAALASSSNPPLFLPGFRKGLEPFHALRFMDWMNTNGSAQKKWSDRAKPMDYSQATSKGIALEHALALANDLKADPWFCMPHQADDEYILSFARLVKEKLDPSLKVYVEYSNEIWNFGFAQAQWIIQNAPGAADSIGTALKAVGQKHCAGAACHPEKDAYMMDRTFRLCRSVFTGADTARMVRVAAVQHAWVDNTRRVLDWLFKEGKGTDAVSPGAYFNFEERHHKAWLAMDPAAVKPSMILDSVNAVFDSTSGAWTRGTAKYAGQYKVDYLVYEGGQHMQPFNQGEHPYNAAVWDAQVHPGMYDLYMRNFREHVKPEVDCKLFMAFSYVSPRKSRWGSWGHLEDYSALDDMSVIKSVAPKYAALLDANASGRPQGILPRRARAAPNGLSAQLQGSRVVLDWAGGGSEPAGFTVLSPSGRKIAYRDGKRSVQGWIASMRVSGWPRGLYFVRAGSGAKKGAKSASASFLIR